MPLNTEIIRYDEAIQMPWTQFEVTAMILAAAFEQGKARPDSLGDYPAEPCRIALGDTYALMNYAVIQEVLGSNGTYTLRENHHFTYVYSDNGPGRLVLMRGDILRAWRSM